MTVLRNQYELVLISAVVRGTVSSIRRAEPGLTFGLSYVTVVMRSSSKLAHGTRGMQVV